MVEYKGRRVLVTGGTGFIGGRLAERLALEEGARVRVLVRNWPKAAWISRANVELIEGDVTDHDTVVHAVEGCDLVFHCVGIGGSLERCMSVNVEGTRNVLSASMQARVKRVVHLSSIAVQGPNPPDNVDERDQFRRTGAPYGDSKIAAEEVAMAFARQKKLSVAIIRPTFVWGPRSEYFTVEQIRRIKNNGWFLVDGGRGTCHAVYVDNLVDALLLAGVKDEADGETFLITDDQPCTWSEFFAGYAHMVGRDTLPSVSSTSAMNLIFQPTANVLDRLLGLLGRTPSREPARFLVRGSRFMLGRTRRLVSRYVPFNSWDLAKFARCGALNTSKARNLLGYQPRISRAVGMRETETWLRELGIIR